MSPPADVTRTAAAAGSGVGFSGTLTPPSMAEDKQTCRSKALMGGRSSATVTVRMTGIAGDFGNITAGFKLYPQLSLIGRRRRRLPQAAAVSF